MARLPITPYPTHCRVRCGVGVAENYIHDMEWPSQPSFIFVHLGVIWKWCF